MGRIQGSSRSKCVNKNRKELRKQKRLQKKQKRQTFPPLKSFAKSQFDKNRVGKALVGAQKFLNFDADVQLGDGSNEVQKVKHTSIVQVPAPTDSFFQYQVRKEKQEQRFKRGIKAHRKEQLRNANKLEDKIIRKLEKRLNIDKHPNDKAVHEMFHDGLDYALEVCLLDNIESMPEAFEDSPSSTETDEEVRTEMRESDILRMKLVEATNTESKVWNESDCRSTKKIATGSRGSDVELKTNLVNKCILNNDFEVGTIKVCEKSSEGREISGLHSDSEQPIKHFNQNAWEDIYGRKRDKDGNLIELKCDKYLPPHLRAQSENSMKKNETLATLQRQCKGFLNRLSEANIHKIASDIEKLYSRNSRFDMNSTLMNLINEAIIKNVLMPERTVLEYTVLIAVLHANIGSEVGAYFLENIIIMVDQFIKNIQNLEVENKEVDNTLLMLCHMYTFTLFHHSLIYGILILLSKKLCEKSIECLLLILRIVGFQLRKDDPVALKHLILRIQKIADAAALKFNDNPRLKFMLKVLLSIKNNNLTVIPQYDPDLAQHMKKILKSMILDGKCITTLNISIEDLLSGEQNGKWWIVGSAWNGKINETETSTHADKLSSTRFSDQLYTLARKHQMNTDDRINIFCIIMSSEDYLYAFERLLHLSIKDQSLIVAIIIHCCLAEKTFNPYYGALAKKFCEHDRKYKHIMEHALRDRIKKIHSASKQENINLVGLLIHLISKGSQSLSILKVIEFGEMDKDTLRFVRHIMLGILLSKEDEYYNVFVRIAPNKKLNVFKDSLRLFMRQFLLKGIKKQVDREKLELLKKRLNIVDEILQIKDFKMKF